MKNPNNTNSQTSMMLLAKFLKIFEYFKNLARLVCSCTTITIEFEQREYALVHYLIARNRRHSQTPFHSTQPLKYKFTTNTPNKSVGKGSSNRIHITMLQKLLITTLLLSTVHGSSKEQRQSDRHSRQRRGRSSPGLAMRLLEAEGPENFSKPSRPHPELTAEQDLVDSPSSEHDDSVDAATESDTQELRRPRWTIRDLDRLKPVFNAAIRLDDRWTRKALLQWEKLTDCDGHGGWGQMNEVAQSTSRTGHWYQSLQWKVDLAAHIHEKRDELVCDLPLGTVLEIKYGEHIFSVTLKSVAYRNGPSFPARNYV